MAAAPIGVKAVYVLVAGAVSLSREGLLGHGTWQLLTAQRLHYHYHYHYHHQQHFEGKGCGGGSLQSVVLP